MAAVPGIPGPSLWLQPALGGPVWELRVVGCVAATREGGEGVQSSPPSPFLHQSTWASALRDIRAECQGARNKCPHSEAFPLVKGTNCCVTINKSGDSTKSLDFQFLNRHLSAVTVPLTPPCCLAVARLPQL